MLKWNGKYFHLAVCCCAFGVIALVNGLAKSRGNTINRKQFNYILKNMDMTIDPCDDFYQYACGNWTSVHYGKPYQRTIDSVDHKANRKFVRIFKSSKFQQLKQKHKFIHHTSDYFDSCKRVLDYRPLEYLNWLSRHESITWPELLGMSNATSRAGSSEVVNVNWLHLLGIFRKYGLNGILLEESVIQLESNSSVAIIDIDKPTTDSGFQLMQREGFNIILKCCGMADDDEIANQLWNDFHLLDVKIKSLENIPDHIGWQQGTLRQLNVSWLEPFVKTILDVSFSPNMSISIQNLPYMWELKELIATEDNVVVQHYLTIRFLWFLNASGPKQFLPLDCVSHTRGMLPPLMSWLYEKFHLNLLKETGNVEELFNALLKNFRRVLKRNYYRFSVDVREFLLSKTNKMDIRVGNLPRHSTLATLTELYKDLQLNSKDFYGNHLKSLKHFTWLKHQAIYRHHRFSFSTGNVNDDFFFLEDATTGDNSSPYYLMRYNKVVVPLTLLAPPIYHSKWHKALKYSLLGFLLAHEIAHGFDETGLAYDLNGNWYDLQHQIQANDCINTAIECLRLDVTDDINDEKLADVAGLRWAYETYFHNSSVEQMLLKQKFSPRRWFFLNFVQFFCGDTHGSTLMDVEHGPDHQRVIDALISFPEFGRVYNCPVGSRMNPHKKCHTHCGGRSYF